MCLMESMWPTPGHSQQGAILTIRHRLLIWLCLLVIAAGLITSPIQSFDPPVQDHAQRVEAILRSMTMRQKVGQLFMVSLGGRLMTDAQQQFLSDYQPGAVVLFGSNLDGQTPEQVTTYINHLQSWVEIPMIVATDQEGGRVWRLQDGFTHFPDPAILGATADPDIAFLMGQAVGREVKAVGVTMNLAPVTDLHTRDDAMNPYRVLNHRTMSEDPAVVGQLAGAMVRGMADVGVVGVVKHFPGHSPTEVDSHRTLPVVTLDRATFAATNRRAFELAIEGGAEVVMVGHLYYPALEPVEDLPSSISPTMVGLLRDDLGFDGIIMTDALEMGAIVNSFSMPQAAVMALEGGVDMIAMGPNAAFVDEMATLEAVYAAVERGDISEASLDESVRRILMLKARYGLLDWEPLDPATARERIPLGQSQEAMIRMFEAGFTVVRDELGMLPLGPEDSVAIVYPIGKPTIREECETYLPDAAFQGFSFVPAEWEYGAAQAVARNADVVIFVGENVGWNIGQGDLLAALPPERTIYVSLWKPYDWEAINPATAGFTVAYSTDVAAQVALCRVLSGASAARAQLPMAIDGYDVGHSLTYDAR